MGILKDIGQVGSMTSKVNPDQPHEVNQNASRRHELIRRHGKSSRMFDERSDNGTEAGTAGMTAGYLIPLESWDFAGRQQVSDWMISIQTQPVKQ